MAIPFRGHTGQGTYFITASAYLKQQLLQFEDTALLFVDVLYHYRGQGKYLLHEFVVMPDHFHLLITPGLQVTLERAMQFIKGGYSYRVKKELGLAGERWQTSFHDRRVRDAAECQFDVAERYPYSSANPKFVLDAVPQRLKPAA